MNTNPTYEPTKCANTSCAFPLLNCSGCRSNKSTKGKAALVVRNPNETYIWVRQSVQVNH